MQKLRTDQRLSADAQPLQTDHRFHAQRTAGEAGVSLVGDQFKTKFRGSEVHFCSLFLGV